MKKIKNKQIINLNLKLLLRFITILSIFCGGFDSFDTCFWAEENVLEVETEETSNTQDKTNLIANITIGVLFGSILLYIIVLILGTDTGVITEGR